MVAYGAVTLAVYSGGPVLTAVLLLGSGAVVLGSYMARAVRRRRRNRRDAADDPAKRSRDAAAG